MFITKTQNPVLTGICSKYRAITLTPVPHQENGSGSRDNYETELLRESQGYNANWTDSPDNLSRVGDLFGFVVGNGTLRSTECYVEVREIVSINGPQSDVRRNSWVPGKNEKKESDKVRNHLSLGPVLGRIEWEVFCELVKWKPYQDKAKLKDPTNPQRTAVQSTQSYKIKI